MQTLREKLDILDNLEDEMGFVYAFAILTTCFTHFFEKIFFLITRRK